MATRMKEKTNKIIANRDNRPKAHARFVRIAPDKVRVVLDLIRGKDINEALAILLATPKAASEIISKVINSAAANAEHNNNMNRDELYVAACYANAGPILKRYRPVSKGRAHHIMKRTCHLTVILDSKEA